MTTKTKREPLAVAPTASCGCATHDTDNGRHALAVDPDIKDRNYKRLRRIEGQVRGLHRMVEEDAYCIDVLTQVSAVTKALQAVALGLLEEHMSHCVASAVAAGGEESEAKLKEAADAIARLVRS